MRNKTPSISVIVPIYNSDKYLQRCIDSILSQDFEDFELLLIDDGSTDNSGDICDKYAEKDMRVRVFHKKNGGVSSARNLGIENAKGEWVVFIDSDDWVINSLWCDNYISDVDMIITSYIDCRGEDADILYDYIITDDEVAAYLQSTIGRNILRGPIAKLFKTDIINRNQLRFCEQMQLGEDTLFVRQYLMQVERIQICNAVFYVVSESFSLSAGLLPVDKAIYAIEALYNALENLELERGIQVTDVKLNDVRFFFIRVLKHLSLEKESFHNRRYKLRKLLDNPRIKMLISDSSYIHKGLRRMLFDFFAKCRCYSLLLLYVNRYQYD